MQSRFSLFIPFLLAGCAHQALPQSAATAVAAPEAAPVEEVKRIHIRPLADYHQHIFGPEFADPPPPEFPAVTLPADIARVLRDRERIGSAGKVADLYSSDAKVLNLADSSDHWVSGEGAIQYAIGGYPSGMRLVPQTYSAGGSSGYVAGIVRFGASPEIAMNFNFGLKKNARGVWQIATESITTRPLSPWGKPITAKDLIRFLDDAGIERAAVLSTAFWAAGNLREGDLSEEQAKLQAGNDWTIEQAALYPDRLIPFCAVNPLKDYSLAEVQRCAKNPRVKGIKMQLGNARVNFKNPAHVAKLRQFFRGLNATGLAAVVHPWTDASWGLADTKIFVEQVLPEAPDIVIQLAHIGAAGGIDYPDVLTYYADLFTAGDPRMKNVYFDLATVVDEVALEERVQLLAREMKRIGLNRFLFGSDMPIRTRAAPVQAWATFRRRIPLTDHEVADVADNVAPYMR